MQYYDIMIIWHKWEAHAFLLSLHSWLAEAYKLLALEEKKIYIQILLAKPNEKL